MKKQLSLMLFSLIAGVSARGDVVAVSEQGFISEHQLTLAATPETAYLALTREVGHWWDPAHSYSGNSENFSLDARAGGCFCETLPNGGSVEHMRVVFAEPGKTLRLFGGLGPLQGMGVAGAMTFVLAPKEAGQTELTYRYVVSGFNPGGWDAVAPAVDQVQLGQLKRLQAYLAAP